MVKQKINNITILKTRLEIIFGLMFKKTINKPHLIILKNEKPVYIHTFFCRFPIDIFFLNIKKTVIDIKRNVKPWTFIGKTVPSAYIIETKSGLLLDINVHDTITWEQ